MSAVSAIYKAPVVGKGVMPEAGEVSVIIQYNGRIYQGVALLHPQDGDFFSEKVGYNVALSRARIEALEDTLIDVQTEARIKEQMYYEATRFSNRSPEYSDPNMMFIGLVMRANQRVKTLQEAIAKEKKILANYLQGQDRALESIKLYRKRQAEAN